MRLAGDLDIAMAPRLELALVAAVARARLLVVDLRELEFVDCAGARVIAGASARARQAGGRLVLLHGSAAVERVFRLTGYLADLEFGIGDPTI